MTHLAAQARAAIRVADAASAGNLFTVDGMDLLEQYQAAKAEREAADAELIDMLFGDSKPALLRIADEGADRARGAW